MIPYICPELPKQQKEAMAQQVKSPILYTNVALRNWRPWKKLGIGAAVSPGDYHVNAMLDFSVSLGGYEYSSSPDEPIVGHMVMHPGITPCMILSMMIGVTNVTPTCKHVNPLEISPLLMQILAPMQCLKQL